LATKAVQTSLSLQSPSLDDNGNGVTNEKIDGAVARDHFLGTGILLAGDFPLIGGTTGDQVIRGTSFAEFGALNISTTSKIARVWAIILEPISSAEGASQPPTVELVRADANTYVGSYGEFTEVGDYRVAVFAMDEEGVASLPATLVITQEGVSVQSGDDPCFLATAIAGTPAAPELRKLRGFRDRQLLTNLLGTVFTDTYYRLSPQFAEWISGRSMLHKLVRYLIVSLLHYPVMSIASLIFFAVSLRCGPWWRRSGEFRVLRPPLW
jgi:hypothetical protein